MITSIPMIATSYFAQGVLSWILPLAVFLAVLLWYFLMVRRRHPE
ncbi:MAG: hypothetical protein QOF06_1528 [Solirubrobacterales bacterium]|jgi:hypothetical protein|nr:hypothetical protein [Solirubrobacterales bacterium]